MDKLDLLKDHKELYRPPSDQPVLVDVPEMQFLTADGTGDPNTSAGYRAAIEALYAMSYTLKFGIKGSESVDYKVMPLEGLWWADDMADFAAQRRDAWKWTMMIAQPPLVTSELVEDTRREVARKKQLPALETVRFESLTAGLSAQIMHVGPYADEAPTIEKLHAFIAEQGHVPTGKHHEIYLGDPRRTAPERLKTVIRQPVA